MIASEVQIAFKRKHKHKPTLSQDKICCVTSKNVYHEKVKREEKAHVSFRLTVT